MSIFDENTTGPVSDPDSRFQPYTVTTGTGQAYASENPNGGMNFGSGLNPALGMLSNASTLGAAESQLALQNSLAQNQGGFSAPQFQSQYQGLGGGNQNYPMASNQRTFNAAGGGGKGPEQGNNGGPPRMDSSFGYSEAPQMSIPSFGGGQANGGPQGDQYTPQAFNINQATDDYFQQGMNVLNPAFQQQNSNLAQALQGSGRGGLQLAAGGMGAGNGGMLNPDAYATGNAQSNVMANLYQQSRQSALGEQAQRYGQDIGTEQQRMGAMGQLFGQDMAANGQQFNQNLQGFTANQGQLQNLSGLNQQQMANLGLFAGMEGNLFNQGLAAEQIRSGANAGSMFQPQVTESTASNLTGNLIGGLAGNKAFGSKIGGMFEDWWNSP